ncbi:serine/threonine protein kinase [Nocardiopsis sp. CNT-189]|uniref:serine/threonine-protein kinase n=1 Tax=Nocardiopsis oceanisediminis TaxID=2816862 RepID=UPI003B321189
MGPSPLFYILLTALALLLLAGSGAAVLLLRRSRRTAPPSPRTAAPEAPPPGLGPADPAQVGPYRLHARLGGGGMGQVFLGRSPGGHTVAVKVVRPDLAQDPDFRRRFAAEAAAARKVGGFYTAQVIDADTDATPPWLATAYIPGPTLHRAVAEHGPLPPESVAVLGAGLAEGLAAVHAAGLVHRDLKPANVLLTSEGPRLIDFGIARALDSASHTHGSTVMGTAAFMSPEQARAQKVGPASDVFSLGCVLAFAATGRSPFGDGPAPALLYRVVQEEPDLTGLAGPLRDLVAACLAKDPADRPAPERIVAECGTGAPTAPSRPEGTWLPDDLTEVVALRETRFLAPDTRPAAPATRTTGDRPVQAPAKKPAKRRRGMTAFAFLALALLLSAVLPQLTTWVERARYADLDTGDCAVVDDGSPAEVPCSSADAEYRVNLTVSGWSDSASRPDHPNESCAESENSDGWVRAVEAPNHNACLEPLAE